MFSQVIRERKPDPFTKPTQEMVTIERVINNLIVKDNPDDAGSAILLTWQVDEENLEGIKFIRIRRAEPGKDFIDITKEDPSTTKFLDTQNIQDGVTYRYTVELVGFMNKTYALEGSEAVSKAQWFNHSKLPILIMLLLLSAAIIYYILSAKSGKDLYIRRISGLDSMDEAVGRATEMGQPILFVPGINDLDDIQTLAGLTILGQLAQKTAEYDAEILVPVSKSMVMSTAREVVKEAYLKAGRSDSFNPDCVFYLTDDQFGFVAGVDGIMVREKPAANFFLGAFYAESLILAETGFSSGSIQTAGTAMPSQLPFFVAACDYTLIGEELFAASAYLSKDPHQLGSLKGQDIGKALFIIVVIIGITLEIAGYSGFKNFLMGL